MACDPRGVHLSFCVVRGILEGLQLLNLCLFGSHVQPKGDHVRLLVWEYSVINRKFRFAP